MIGNTTETGSLMSNITTMGFFFLIVCLVVAGVGWFYLRMKSKDDTLRMVLEATRDFTSNADRAASMDAIYQKHHKESIEANNRIVNRVPKQIETISEVQTQTIEGVYDLSTLTQSLCERIEVLSRTLADSEHLTRVENQVQDSQARSEQQYNYVTSQANALADQIREIERQADQQQKSREQNDAHVARALVTLTQQNQQLMETNNNLMKKIERIIA